MELQALANRLVRNRARLEAFARRHDLTAWRLYDLDIPEFRCTVDVYGEHVVVTALQGLQDDAAFHRALATTVAETLRLPADRVHLKVRRRHAPGETQYEKAEQDGPRLEVREQGQRFLVDLDQYVDTGLFMDHRRTRALVRDEAKGRRVLNLFCYTGAFTVYAAHGGATETTSVDASPRYLEWARANLTLNGLDGPGHRFIRADVLEWLPHATGMFDLAIVDPPSFSSGGRVGTTWDVQRDHVDLLARVRARLAPGGVLYFSTNFRGFRPDERAFHGTTCRELTPASIPDDFRQRDIHRCWRMEQRPNTPGP
ncbi:MAG: class I SAM-dependent methyltransferase [Deltaproteobacteria bacterium]|nr:class I SAM-dependent methyltransferase [Deltaproteobacteria bacterium]